jgi:hypothetical protein
MGYNHYTRKNWTKYKEPPLCPLNGLQLLAKYRKALKQEHTRSKKVAIPKTDVDKGFLFDTYWSRRQETQSVQTIAAQRIGHRPLVKLSGQCLTELREQEPEDLHPNQNLLGWQFHLEHLWLFNQKFQQILLQCGTFK